MEASNPGSLDLVPALEAARRGDEDAELELLRAIRLAEGSGASSDELWLQAELAYLEGRYVEAIRQFEVLERKIAHQRMPAWQHYGSAHRRMVALYFAGEFQRSREALAQAEQLVSGNPELQFRQANVDAMHAHFLELEGDLEAAKARFILAYNAAAGLGHWSRAAGMAAAVGQVASEQTNFDEALRWLNVAHEANAREPAQRIEQVIEIRLARLYRVMRKTAEARHIYEQVIRRPTPDRDASALLERAELMTEQGDYAAAEADLKRSIELSEERGVRFMGVSAYRALADFYLARGTAGDDGRASQAFARYARLVLSLQPIPARPLIQLAEQVLAEPRRIGKTTLPEPLRRPLQEALEACRLTLKPDLYGRALRGARSRAALQRLEAELLFLKEPEIRLASWTVLPAARKVIPRSGNGQSKRISDGELVALHQLLHARPPGLTTTELAERLDVSWDAATKLVERLRKLLRPDLVTNRSRGNLRLYSLRTASDLT